MFLISSQYINCRCGLHLDEYQSIDSETGKFGKGKKMALFTLIVQISDLNPLRDWKEDGLIGEVQVYSVKVNDMTRQVVFHISKHCVYRIFERNYRTSKSKGSKYYSLDLIYRELEYLPIFSALIRYIFLTLHSDDNNDKGFLNGLSIIVPTYTFSK